MPKTPGISEAEWEVMEIAWRHAPKFISAQIFVDALSSSHDWHPKTVKTLLARLLKKEALAHKAEGNKYLYRAAVSQKQCIRAEGRSFIQRVFGGDSVATAMHFVDQANLSPEELDELRNLLDKKSKR